MRQQQFTAGPARHADVLVRCSIPEDRERTEDIIVWLIHTSPMHGKGDRSVSATTAGQKQKGDTRRRLFRREVSETYCGFLRPHTSPKHYKVFSNRYQELIGNSKTHGRGPLPLEFLCQVSDR
jgi:hypothetical protein